MAIIENKKITIILLLITVIIIASFFRLWQLDKIPPGLYPDVAMNGNNALETLRTGDFKVFYTDNNGREGMIMWLDILSFSIFGISIWSMKIVAAIFGILTVLGLYLLVKEIFKNIFPNSNKPEIIALLASFFLATSFWHTLFSRIGFRAILLPFILVFSFYFLFKGFRTKNFLNIILGGVFFGLGFYTYTSFRMAVLLLFITLIGWLLIYWKEGQFKKFLLFAVCFSIFTFIIALPLGIYFLHNPQDFISRATGVSIFAQPNLIKAFFVSLAAHLGMFNFYGDGNWRHNYPTSPMLFWPVGIIFLIGFIISIKEIIISLKSRSWLPFTVYGSLLAWFFALLLPGVLTYEGIPHALRVIGVIPVVYIFAALGGYWLYNWFNKKNKIRGLLLVISIFLIFSVGYNQFYKYFFLWGENPNVKGAFTEKYAEIGYYLNSLPLETQKYVIVNEPGVPVPLLNGLPVPAQTLMFIESTKYGQPDSVYLLPENLDSIKIYKNTTIVPMKDDENLFNELKQKFPQGIIKKVDDFSVYEVE